MMGIILSWIMIIGTAICFLIIGIGLLIGLSKIPPQARTSEDRTAQIIGITCLAAGILDFAWLIVCLVI